MPPPAPHARHDRRNLYRSRRIAVALALAAVVVVVVLLLPGSSDRKDPAGSVAGRGARPGGGATVPGRSSEPSTQAGHSPAVVSLADSRCPCPNLVAGSNPAVLPGAVLVADHRNNRLLIIAPNGNITWEFPRPGDLGPGQTFDVPDDAFFTPDGRYIVATQEDDFLITMVSIAEHRIVWRYGTPGVPGSGPNQLWNPDDAMMMPNGNIVAADIKNCRLLVLRPGFGQPVQIFGTTTQACWHGPPGNWGSPNGAFPMLDGNYLVTEINGDWIDELTLGGVVRFSAHPPGIAYPSDTNEVRPGVYLTADYSSPGQVEEFNGAGQLLWRYTPANGDNLDHPSLALPLPNGDVLCNDDFNHRVIVIDPRTNRIVWQYGHTGVAGAAAGFLNDPDGVDLMPPLSLTITHAASMGEYPVPAGAGPAPGMLGH